MMQETHQFSSLDAANIGSGLTVGGGMGLWLTQNATAIGVILAIFTAFMTMVFYLLTYRATIRGQDIRKSEIERRIFSEMTKDATEDEKKIIRRLIRREED